MSTETNPISDLELVRYLDGELEPKERSALDSRLATAPDAAARLEQLRRRSRNMSALLRAEDPGSRATLASAAAIRPLLPRRVANFGWPPYLKAAAAVALLLTAAFAVPPARAWLLARLLDVREAVGLGSTTIPTPAPAPAPAAATVSTAEVSYSFTVSSDTFAVEVTQNAGQLIVQLGSERSGSAEAAGASDASFLVLPRGVRIEGPATRGAVYTVTLPVRVTVVLVQRAAGAAYYPLRSGQPLTFDLSGR